MRNATDAATAELAEESLGLFQMNIGRLMGTGAVTALCPWAPLHPKNGDYTAFVVRVSSPINKKWYDDNLGKIMSARGVPSSWRETNGMTRFYLDDLAQVVGAQGNVSVRDVYGAVCVVDGRAKAVIREFLKASTTDPILNMLQTPAFKKTHHILSPTGPNLTLNSLTYDPRRVIYPTPNF
jgi:hypothetical protein